MKPALLATFTAALFFAGSAFAATSGTLNLSGTVTPNFALVVTAAANNDNVNLDIVNGANAKLVGSVNEQSNNATGYKIQASSQNNGFLKNGSVQSVSYQLKYGNGSAQSLTTTAQTVFTSAALTSPANNNQNVAVTFTGLGANAMAGTFSDTVTFTISAP
jgi:hypothetical protein